MSVSATPPMAECKNLGIQWFDPSRFLLKRGEFSVADGSPCVSQPWMVNRVDSCYASPAQAVPCRAFRGRHGKGLVAVPVPGQGRRDAQEIGAARKGAVVKEAAYFKTTIRGNLDFLDSTFPVRNPPKTPNPHNPFCLIHSLLSERPEPELTCPKSVC